MMSAVERDLLLCAALHQGAAAIEAWARWEEAFGLDQAGAAALELMPQIYRNLLEQGLDPDGLGRLKGIYRHQWARSQSRLPALAAACRALHGAAIPCVLLGGLALRMAYYPEPGYRPFTVGELWLPPALADAARDVLHNLGWKPIPRTLFRRFKDAVRGRCYHTWKNPDGLHLRVHRHLVPGRATDARDRMLAADAMPLLLLDAPVRVLSPASMLLSLSSTGCFRPHPLTVADTAWVGRTAERQGTTD